MTTTAPAGRTSARAGHSNRSVTGSDLAGPDLVDGAVPGGADRDGADLGGADLGGPNLGGPNLGGPDLDDADLDGPDVDAAVLGGPEPDAFRSVFRRHAAGVTVVTLDGPAGPVGFTATSVASLSLDPPLVSLSVSGRSSSWPALVAADTLVVHLLAADQHATAARFAASAVDRFAAPTRWTRLPTGEPHLPDAPAWLRCRVEHRIATGDHHLLVARVLDARLLRHRAPLVYHDGGYGTLAGERPDQAPE